MNNGSLEEQLGQIIVEEQQEEEETIVTKEFFFASPLDNFDFSYNLFFLLLFV